MASAMDLSLPGFLIDADVAIILSFLSDVCMYIYIERERETERATEREGEICGKMHSNAITIGRQEQASAG